MDNLADKFIYPDQERSSTEDLCWRVWTVDNIGDSDDLMPNEDYDISNAGAVFF